MGLSTSVIIEVSRTCCAGRERGDGRLLGGSTALVAVFVALSKNAAANMTAAVMASIQGLSAR